MQPTRTLLDDGRWHFQYGPIDLVISADGNAAAIHDAVESSWLRFAEILPELVAELSLLRQPMQQTILQVAQKSFAQVANLSMFTYM